MRNGGCLCPSAIWRSCSLRIRHGSVFWIISLKFFPISMSLSDRCKVTMSDSSGRHRGRESQPIQENRGQGNVRYVTRDIPFHQQLLSACKAASLWTCPQTLPHQATYWALANLISFLIIFFFYKIYPRLFFWLQCKCSLDFPYKENASIGQPHVKKYFQTDPLFICTYC